MPIVQVPYGSANLLAQSDYQRINNLLATNFMNVNKAIWEDAANNIVQGAVFHVGGTVYYANAATAIGGVASDYIKLTPGGVTPNMTLTPSYVANLAGVTWNSAYNGYYDVSGNAYVFDELVALQAGEIASVNTKLWKAINALITGDFEISGNHEYSGDPTFSGDPEFSGDPTYISSNSIQFKSKILPIGDWNMDITLSVSIAHGLTLANIRSITALIRNNTNTIYTDFSTSMFAGGIASDRALFATAANISIQRGTNGFYDNANYDSIAYNRGWITIIYEV